MKKKLLSLLIMTSVVMSVFSGCANNISFVPAKTVEVTDSLGRTVTIPQKIEKVIPSGQLAQIVLLSLCPEKMVAIASRWDAEVEPFIPENVYNLPCVGQLYGGKKDFNLEAILAAAPDVIIDVGDAKKGMENDLDDLQAQIGIPILHLDGGLSKLPDTYTFLGDILALSGRAAERADYCKRKNTELSQISEKIDKMDALLITGPEGLNVIANGSYQGEAFDAFFNNLAVIENPSGKGTGNEVDMEQILNWNPDIIIYLPETTPKETFAAREWKEITAVKEGQIYKVPFGPYNWLGFPASIQRYLGMMWIAATFYPDAVNFDLYDEVKEYYAMFYGYVMDGEMYERLIAQ